MAVLSREVLLANLLEVGKGSSRIRCLPSHVKPQVPTVCAVGALCIFLVQFILQSDSGLSPYVCNQKGVRGLATPKAFGVRFSLLAMILRGTARKKLRPNSTASASKSTTTTVSF